MEGKFNFKMSKFNLNSMDQRVVLGGLKKSLEWIALFTFRTTKRTPLYYTVLYLLSSRATFQYQLLAPISYSLAWDICKNIWLFILYGYVEQNYVKINHYQKCRTWLQALSFEYVNCTYEVNMVT
jgi:hypothetical protein